MIGGFAVMSWTWFNNYMRTQREQEKRLQLKRKKEKDEKTKNNQKD